jgi:hypothetical protein
MTRTTGSRARTRTATARPSSPGHRADGCVRRRGMPRRRRRDSSRPPRSRQTTQDGSPAATLARLTASETTARDHTHKALGHASVVINRPDRTRHMRQPGLNATAGCGSVLLPRLQCPTARGI